MGQEGGSSYIVEQVFVVYRDGRLIVDCAREGCETKDADLMSGMLIAIQGLIQDGLRSGGVLRSIFYGDNVVSLVNGEYVVLAAVLYGDVDETFRESLKEVVGTIEGSYASELPDWSGDLDEVSGIQKLVQPLVSGTADITRDDVMVVAIPEPLDEGAGNVFYAKRDIIINLENRIKDTIYCTKCGRCIDRVESFQCPECQRVLCADHQHGAGEPCDDCRKVLKQEANVKESFYDEASGSIRYDSKSAGELKQRVKESVERLGLLEIHLPEGEREVVYLSEEGLRDYVRIGRDESNDIVLSDPQVSRNHAQIYAGKDGLYIVDSCSAHGIRVNDEEVTVAMLMDGSLISMGEQLLFYSEDFLSLVFMNGPEEGRTVMLEKVMITRDFNIGRCPTNEIVIDEGSVSRHHARILVHRDEMFIEDIGSMNGTLLNGELVKGFARLDDGDVIAIGGAEMTFMR